MIDLDLFHFLRPQWFIALAPLALLIWFMFFRKGAQSNWETVVDPRLLPHILVRGAGKPRRTAIILTLTGGLLGIFALAGPAWDKLPQPVFTSQDALVIALDLTRSMNANDVSPSRLERARYKISDILDQRREGQTALLVYAGDAFTVTPLTDDAATIKSQLNALSPGIMPATGNRADKAVALASNLLKQAGMRRGHALLITDDANVDDAGARVAALRNAGYRLSVLGVGTRHGAPVLLPDGGFLQDGSGNIVIPVLDERALRALADSGGGIYARVSKDDQDITRLSGFFAAARPGGEQADSDITADVWREQGPWLVLGLLPLGALLFRRGMVLALALFLFPSIDPAHAFDWESLWLRKDQQGQRAMVDGDYATAAGLFSDPAWKAAAQHRSGNYQGAIDSLEALDDTLSHYNRGNALARLGRYQEAIAAYDRTLAEQPDHADALFNKELLEQELAQQQQQPQQNQGQQDQEASQQTGQQPEAEDGEQEQQQAGQDQQQQSRSPQAGEKQEHERQNETPQPETGEQAQQQPQPEQGQQGREQTMAAAAAQKTAEEQQATEQWLRRIPDDPSGLLRRKFRYQYQQRNYENNGDEQSW